MTIVQYIKPAKFETEMFKLIKSDNDSAKHLKLSTSNYKGKQSSVLFIKSKKIKNCELIPRKSYDLKVIQTGIFRNKPVLKYNLQKCDLEHSNINNEHCSIDYSSDIE